MRLPWRSVGARLAVVVLVGELSLSMAWLRHAPQLTLPQSQFQPAVSFTLGAGF